MPNGMDPYGMACLVFYKCFNTGQTRLDWNTVRCHYSCTIDKTKGKGGIPGMRTVNVGGISCDDIKNENLATFITDFTNHFDLVGKCNCAADRDASKLYDHWKNPFRDCSRSKCKAEAKKRLKGLKNACKLYPPGPLRKLCQAAAKSTQLTFDELCDQCKNP